MSDLGSCVHMYCSLVMFASDNEELSNAEVTEIPQSIERS